MSTEEHDDSPKVRVYADIDGHPENRRPTPDIELVRINMAHNFHAIAFKERMKNGAYHADADLVALAKQNVEIAMMEAESLLERLGYGNAMDDIDAEEADGEEE